MSVLSVGSEPKHISHVKWNRRFVECEKGSGLSCCNEHCESEEKWNGVVVVAGVEREEHDY